MSVSLSDRWQDHEDDRASGGERMLAMVRAVATPSNLTLAGAVTFGWLALVAWTGNGPEGWQARSCAELDLGRTSCSAVRFTKDQSRLAPHVSTVGFAR